MRHGRDLRIDSLDGLVSSLADALGHSLEGPWVANRKDFEPDSRPWMNLQQAEGLFAPKLRDFAGRCDHMDTYRKGLWSALKAKNRMTISALQSITEETTIVCECKPAPCHGDIVLAAWRWAKKEGML